MYGWILLFHILGATVWTGGHLLLASTILPAVLRDKDVERLLRFEAAYERVGIPALLLQILTGAWLAHQMAPDIRDWLNLSNPLCRPIAAKLALLAITVSFAGHARWWAIPRLSKDNLVSMAWHVYPITIMSVLFVMAGVSFRTGWLS